MDNCRTLLTMLKLTFDTQCLRYLDPDHRSPLFVIEMTELMSLAEQGLIDAVRVGTIVKKDLMGDPARLAEREQLIDGLPVKNLAGVMVLGEWELGRDVVASDEAEEVLGPQSELSRKVDERDRLHLRAHRAHSRDIFVTTDSGILKASVLLASADIRVMTPDEALGVVQASLA